MPHYVDSEGARYWFDEAPEVGTVRDDLVLTTEGDPQTLAPVPEAVTMRQARLALLGAGILPHVETTIASLPSPHKEAAQIEWEYATDIRRDHALVTSLKASLGLTDADLDNLFITAATL